MLRLIERIGIRFLPKWDLSKEDVKAYFRKNDDVNLSVPLAIARQVREEVVHGLGHGRITNTEEVWCAVGMLRGIARFEHIYETAIGRRDKYVTAAGKVEE